MEALRRDEGPPSQQELPEHTSPVVPQIPILLMDWEWISIRRFSPTRFLPALFETFMSVFRRRATPQLEILALRHQLVCYSAPEAAETRRS